MDKQMDWQNWDFEREWHERCPIRDKKNVGLEHELTTFCNRNTWKKVFGMWFSYGKVVYICYHCNKKFKDKAFARSVSRDDIRKGAEELGVDLSEHVLFVARALEAVAS